MTEDRLLRNEFVKALHAKLSRLYPATLHLKTHVHTRAVGQRPLIELEATEHPLAVEQRNGITMERVREIAAALLHPTEGAER